MNHSVIHEDTPQIRGMLHQVHYLVRVEAAEGVRGTGSHEDRNDQATAGANREQAARPRPASGLGARPAGVTRAKGPHGGKVPAGSRAARCPTSAGCEARLHEHPPHGLPGGEHRLARALRDGETVSARRCLAKRLIDRVISR